jgi:alpha-N-arabinofuranosidase
VGGVEEQFDLSDALAVGTYLNGFIRQCRTVKLANLAQLVNAIGAVFTSKEGLFLQTIYHPLRLYAEHTLDTALDVHVDGPMYDLRPEQEDEKKGRVHHVADLGPFSLLDVTATCDEAARTLTLAVVNRDKDQSHKATIDLGGAEATGGVQVSEVTGPHVGATNSFAEPNLVGVRDRQVDVKGGPLDYEFPARSVSVLRMRLR